MSDDELSDASKMEQMQAELAAYHRFHEAINGKIGLLRVGYGDAKAHADAISDAFATLHKERLASMLEIS